MTAEKCAIGVDLGGTKIEVALVDGAGRIHKRLRHPTDVEGGPSHVERTIVTAIEALRAGGEFSPAGVGVGMAGQIEPQSGAVHYAPNLDWHDVPLQADLARDLDLPVVVTNDVRAATWGEWLYGAGKGIDDLICIFVGTGIGGGVVSGGRILTGCSNSAGEIGHLTIDLHGPMCHCGNRGCLEALAGGWAIARRAIDAVSGHPDSGATLLRLAGNRREAITTRIVAEAYHQGDPLARLLIEEAAEALVAGAVSLVNAFNPCRLILGGGVIDGLPELVAHVDQRIRHWALTAATQTLEVVPSHYGNDAGVVGAAAVAMRSFSST